MTARIVLIPVAPLLGAIVLVLGGRWIRERVRQPEDGGKTFPIAAGAFYPAFGLLLRPEIAPPSMAGSSLLVAINALLLKRTRLPGIRTTRPGEPGRPAGTPDVTAAGAAVGPPVPAASRADRGSGGAPALGSVTMGGDA